MVTVKCITYGEVVEYDISKGSLVIATERADEDWYLQVFPVGCITAITVYEVA